MRIFVLTLIEDKRSKVHIKVKQFPILTYIYYSTYIGTFFFFENKSTLEKKSEKTNQNEENKSNLKTKIKPEKKSNQKRKNLNKKSDPPVYVDQHEQSQILPIS